MKYLAFALLIFSAISVRAQIVFASPDRNDFKSITLIVNREDVNSSQLILNDLKHAPVTLVVKKDTTISNVRLIKVFNPAINELCFLSVPLNLSMLTLYDSKFKIVANLNNDSYSWHIANEASQTKSTPPISPEQLVKLFMLLL
ncbi:hypothetical protein SAMN05428975_3610 [Mucilaginibacter sp. OK268]|uniref:hypothetical protein n=1 Tax=Mucilaginibacter sp. OK268 TaxID=1881048 RepID=UPI0008841956|nr:hypothetical protein [Mucilaginibacter sp. OK268]SDP91905.1 hypothetical protein SAMN05428975_3610 [Mucilaginibacter sp. OK268]